MTKEELIAFRNMIGYSQQDLANALGYCLRNIQKMEDGTYKIRNSVGLSCAALALGILQYDGPQAAMYVRQRKKGNRVV